jgi:thymidine kinase
MSNESTKNPALTTLCEGLSKSLFLYTADEARAQGICVKCKEKIFYSPGRSAEREGHIYSVPGQNEYRITAMCEYCYDKMFEDTVEPGERELEDLESFVLDK